MQTDPKEKVSGVWRHYSGLVVYVLGVARHSETEERFVAYIPLAVKMGPRITVRPYEMFFEEVEQDGKRVARFEYLGDEMPAGLAEGYNPLSKKS